MKIIIIHHHLNPGGVTRVIQSQIQSLKENNSQQKVLLMTGDSKPLAEFEALGVRVFPDNVLNYLTEPYDTEFTLKSILNILKQQSKKEDILHVHNPNLGKNPLLTLALYKLAKSGYKIVYHIHDFAEDRPLNVAFLQKIIKDYFCEDLKSVMYPNVENVSYAPLTRSDAVRLEQYGVDKNKIHVLPNPIKTPGLAEKSLAKIRTKIIAQLGLSPNKKIVTYPVRVIQRKNIGEFLLLSVLLEDEAQWLVTQPPLNPVEIKQYEQWQSFCREIDSSVIFEAGKKVRFDELMFVSDFCITTSLREGFGMVYLEPWLYGTPVIGRNIPQVTEDFAAKGIVFDQLYEQLLVLHDNRKVDFKGLSAEHQRKIIAQVKFERDFGRNIFTLNPFLHHMLQSKNRELLSKNKAIIEKSYSLTRYGHELEKIYRALSQ